MSTLHFLGFGNYTMVMEENVFFLGNTHLSIFGWRDMVPATYYVQGIILTALPKLFY